MRRIFVFTLLVLVVATTANAHGLYKGHGLRSKDLWQFRLNGSLGLHGTDNRNTDIARLDPFDAGGFVDLGLELRLNQITSMELFAGARSFERTSDFSTNSTFFDGSYHEVDLDAVHFGGTLRRYDRSQRAYAGVGGGIVSSEVQSFSDSGDSQSYFFQEDSGSELHFVLGFEGRLSQHLALGVEVGHRWTTLARDNEFDGVFGGLRVGILFPGR